MPIYEYECTSCHHHFDIMQKINDKPAQQCPRCLEPTAIRLISAAGFQLKGSGWYATDFKNKGKPEAKSDTGSRSENSSEKKTDDKSEAKPAKPTESNGSSSTKKGDSD